MDETSDSNREVRIRPSVKQSSEECEETRAARKSENRLSIVDRIKNRFAHKGQKGNHWAVKTDNWNLKMKGEISSGGQGWPGINENKLLINHTRAHQGQWSLYFWKQYTRKSWGPWEGRQVSSKSPSRIQDEEEGSAGRNGRKLCFPDQRVKFALQANLCVFTHLVLPYIWLLVLYRIQFINWAYSIHME